MLRIQRDPKVLTDFIKSVARNPRGQRRLGFSLCTLLVVLCVPLYAIDRDRRIDELYHTHWTYTDGAPGEVRALAQTTDGYLWLGTATGLFRFDGIRFQDYKPQSGQAFPQRSVASLFALPDGGLWVSYSYGGVSLIKDGAVTDYGKPVGLPDQAVLAFARDRQGTIWIAAGKDGLARLEGSRWRKIGIDWGFADEAYTVFVDHVGTLWVGTPTAVSYLLDGGRHFQIAAQGLGRVNNLAESSDGTLWMAERGYGVRPVPSRKENEGRSGPAVLVGAPEITFDNQGSLWITTAGNGIRRVPYPERLHSPKIKGPSAWQFHNSEVEAFTQQNGLTSDYMYCVLQDREGNVWIGGSGGLDRFRQSPVVSVPLQPISYPGALPIPSLHSFTTSALAAGDQGTLWVTGIGPQVLLKIQKDRIVTQLRDEYVDCAYRDPNGVVWLATPSSVLRLADERLHPINSTQRVPMYNYDGATPAGYGLILRRLDLPSGGTAVIPHSRAKAITQDPLGRLWISMESGTFRLERSGWTSLESLGGPHGSATAEFTDSEGDIWFGFGNTIAMLDGKGVRIFSASDGVQVGTVTSIQEKGREIWIGGEFGLEFFDGSRFQPVTPSDGSALASVSGIVADAQGGLWFSETRGIVHIREAQARQSDSSKLEFESFGLSDGLTAQLRGSLASPSAVQTTDGRIWFATTTGAAWINPNPERILRNTVPPPVLIESVSADGREYNNSTFLRLPPRTENLRIAYTATSLVVPERVRFRYKLDGLDNDWQEPGTRREAVYTNLGTGSYTFRVIACNNDGVWNDAGASLAFSIAPAYYQTNWFRALCASAFLVLLWMAYQFRLRHLRKQFAITLDARVGERTRIARELHDTLLQSLHGLLFQFQAARNMLPARPQDAIRTLDGAISRTEQAITESRSTIQGLRHESQTDLAQSLAAMAQDLMPKEASGHSPVFRVIVEGERQTLSPLVQEEVGQIAGELLRNAFQHALAREIEAEIHFDQHLFRVRVRDDGKGMDRTVMDQGGRAGHWGLKGVRERAQRIGAELDFWSEAGAGTEVQLTVPSAIAYKTTRDGAGFKLRKAKS